MAHQHKTEEMSDGRLIAAIAFNLLLTVAEVVGGVVSGSLSLVADALHNFNDCASLFIALVARRIARKPADRRRTFGYRRAEVVGALINLTVLIVVGLYLVYEAIDRFIEPREIEGWTVLVIAGIALVVDVSTALLLLAMSRGNLNLRAAFLHNVSDALGSLAVIVVGVAIILWELYFLDVVVTLLIAGYILWQSVVMIRQAIRILMESVPEDLDIERLVAVMQEVGGVVDIHHLHVWQLDEHHLALEAHVVVEDALWPEIASVKRRLKSQLEAEFEIEHSTLEFEQVGEDHGGPHDRSLISGAH